MEVSKRRRMDHSRAGRHTQPNWRVPNLIGPTSGTSEAELSQRLQPGTSAKLSRNFSASQLSLAKRLRRAPVPTKIQAGPEPRKKHFPLHGYGSWRRVPIAQIERIYRPILDLRKIQIIIFKFEKMTKIQVRV
jgi:hypothetical protein